MARYIGTSSSAFTENDNDNNNNKKMSSIELYVIISICIIFCIIGLIGYFTKFRCIRNKQKNVKTAHKDDIELVEDESEPKEYNMSPITPNDDEAVIQIETDTTNSNQT